MTAMPELSTIQSSLPGYPGQTVNPEGPATLGAAAPSPVPTPIDPRLCRLCLMAAIVFAFGKDALMLI